MHKSKQKTHVQQPADNRDDNRSDGVENAEAHGSRASSDYRADNRLIEWLPVHCSSSYEVSNTGQVRRCKPGRRTRVGFILRQYADKDGYLRTCLSSGSGDKGECGRGKRVLVHRLVAEAFIGPMPDGYTVDHIDGNKGNNHATNLQYVTRAENVKRAHGMGKYHFCRGENSAQAKLTEVQVAEIKRLLPTMNNCAIARIYGVSDVAIRKIRLGRTWSHVA